MTSRGAKIKLEDLIEGLLDKRVLDAIAANTSQTTAQLVEEMLNQKFDVLVCTVTDLKRENAMLKTEVTSLSKSHTEMMMMNADLNKCLETNLRIFKRGRLNKRPRFCSFKEA